MRTSDMETCRLLAKCLSEIGAITAQGQSIRLKELFVDPQKGGSPFDAAGRARSGSVVHTLLAPEKRTVLLAGHPGTGKSTSFGVLAEHYHAPDGKCAASRGVVAYLDAKLLGLTLGACQTPNDAAVVVAKEICGALANAIIDRTTSLHGRRLSVISKLLGLADRGGLGRSAEFTRRALLRAVENSYIEIPGQDVTHEEGFGVQTKRKKVLAGHVRFDNFGVGTLRARQQSEEGGVRRKIKNKRVIDFAELWKKVADILNELKLDVAFICIDDFSEIKAEQREMVSRVLAQFFINHHTPLRFRIGVYPGQIYYLPRIAPKFVSALSTDPHSYHRQTKEPSLEGAEDQVIESYFRPLLEKRFALRKGLSWGSLLGPVAKESSSVHEFIRSLYWASSGIPRYAGEIIALSLDFVEPVRNGGAGQYLSPQQLMPAASLFYEKKLANRVHAQIDIFPDAKQNEALGDAYCEFFRQLCIGLGGGKVIACLGSTFALARGQEDFLVPLLNAGYVMKRLEYLPDQGSMSPFGIYSLNYGLVLSDPRLSWDCKFPELNNRSFKQLCEESDATVRNLARPVTDILRAGRLVSEIPVH